MKEMVATGNSRGPGKATTDPPVCYFGSDALGSTSLLICI